MLILVLLMLVLAARLDPYGRGLHLGRQLLLLVAMLFVDRLAGGAKANELGSIQQARLLQDATPTTNRGFVASWCMRASSDHWRVVALPLVPRRGEIHAKTNANGQHEHEQEPQYERESQQDVILGLERLVAGRRMQWLLLLLLVPVCGQLLSLSHRDFGARSALVSSSNRSEFGERNSHWL